mgnify:CR=1 FL=1
MALVRPVTVGRLDSKVKALSALAALRTRLMELVVVAQRRLRRHFPSHLVAAVRAMPRLERMVVDTECLTLGHQETPMTRAPLAAFCWVLVAAEQGPRAGTRHKAPVVEPVADR